MTDLRRVAAAWTPNPSMFAYYYSVPVGLSLPKGFAGSSGTSFCGPIRFSADGGWVDIRGGGGGGGFWGNGGTMERRAAFTGALLFNYPGVNTGCITYLVNDLLVNDPIASSVADRAKIQRFNTSGTLAATYTLPVPVSSSVRFFEVLGDVIYYQSSFDLILRRWSISSGAMSNWGSIPSLGRFDVDSAERVLLVRPTSVDLYAAGGSLIRNFPVGTQVADTRFDPDGASIWHTAGGTVTRKRISDGATLFTSASLGGTVQGVDVMMLDAPSLTHTGAMSSDCTVFTGTISAAMHSPNIVLSRIAGSPDLTGGAAAHRIAFTMNTTGHALPAGGSLATPSLYAAVGDMPSGSVVKYAITRADAGHIDGSCTMRATESTTGDIYPTVVQCQSGEWRRGARQLGSSNTWTR